MVTQSCAWSLSHVHGHLVMCMWYNSAPLPPLQEVVTHPTPAAAAPLPPLQEVVTPAAGIPENSAAAQNALLESEWSSRMSKQVRVCVWGGGRSEWVSCMSMRVRVGVWGLMH